MAANLKQLIKSIRATKTLAEERDLIQRESAAIRTSFKEDEAYARHNNIAKLLYIHMLGYSAHFGQIECLKLVASPKFADKRLGYLGIMLLLDESTEVLTLVTNSLKNDMNHSNMYIVGLSLCCFANIASEEMSRDLVNEVEKLLGSSNTYIRKKAALCALRIVHKVPDLLDHFVTRATSLLSDRNHGVLLTGVTLVTDMCAIDPQATVSFRKAVPLLVRHLKALVTTGYSPEHDVSGITDPFLQVKVLRLLRLLGTGDAEGSEAMNDILAQVATNTESAKNVGNAILYEAVLTILDIEAESGLRVMAINILGKFLSNKDNNIRYVALNTLNKVVGIDTNAVQRHRSIILDCLRDGDISIRRRALELSYALINESNVRVLTRELLSFLEVADNEFKLGMTTQLCHAAERFAPNKRWHIDTVLRVLKVAGNYVREEVLGSFVRLVCHTPELQAYTVQKLYSALRADVSQESLTLAGVWMIGEYGDVLLQGGNYEEEDLVREVKESDVVDLLETIIVSPYVNATTRQYILTAAAKLSTRFSDHSDQQSRLRTLLHRFDTSVEVEIQQRAVEFEQLLASTVRAGVLERMPPPELRASVMGTVSEKRAVGSTRADKDSLLDMTGDEASPVLGGPASKQSTQDLLADIFGSSGTGVTAPSAAVSSANTGGARTVDDILGLFGGAANGASTAPVSSRPPVASPMSPSSGSASLFDLDTSTSPMSAITASMPAVKAVQPEGFPAYSGHGLRVTIAAKRDVANPQVVNLTAHFTAEGMAVMSINFQAAVPRTQKLQMRAISSADLQAGQSSSQELRVMIPPGAQVRLRLRIAFQSGGAARQEQTDFSLPPDAL